ncbi:cryptochrome/photolyase family protein [Herbaspirillum seropedicae]|uniref:Deoxyribodipyrimidine photolyase protein n=1 Tax=Herbaspirillum seropedicae (strain SmR1) TaxID=757424 RepID=D8IR78_HERSS|nr:cryptochrome/photolyase family protein [Herbaspirillum seropedicae]ADJ65204.1 deoxyribodipyrimidine photolyase protein [Herbaspirillum seropedicae SmR1]AKN67062.1 deoxyribodipyrimidine photolyase [Herbaspirillum seropedicae]NQE30336.1 deoxyribodipyrimidine photolyase [Herbaspirillum seropedicae]UMU23066.1 cryptochrome/photolyase family protein [Herbaspirillum seropedicae]
MSKDPSAPPRAATLRLILGDQLNPRHSWFDQCDDQVVYLLMEVRSETDYVLHHAQKVLALFAAMRDFAARLKAGGHRVRYIRLDDPSNRQSLVDNLSALARHYQASQVQWQAPDEWRVDEALRQWAQAQPLQTSMADSEHFLTDRHELPRLFSGRKQWLMEHFYRQMRRRFELLLEADGSPTGGQWNFDHDNRKRWPGTPAEPADWRQPHDHSALWEMLQACAVPTFGDPQASQLRWPLNREEALAHLEHFITHALPCFGDFEDAMSSRAQRLFHSLLSFALNVKMLHPLEVVRRAEEAYREGQAPLAAVEGFVRQIIGWREYVRGIYWSQMPGYEDRNVLDHGLPLPAWFWTGQTRMRCLQQAIGQSLQSAHAHHIQRLMVIGNFALLAGLDPKALHQWYLGVYIDAFEWVELPNTLGMSQWADGGIIATKPYVSSAAYIGRMSDYCQGCAYDPRQRHSEDACPYNALYWDFFLRHQERFGKNARMGMAYQQLRKMDTQELARLRERAAHLRERLDQL